MKTSKVNFIASVEDANIADINKIAKQLRQLGCDIDNVLSFSGIITGSTAPNLSLNDLKIKGIKNVEPDRSVKAMGK